MTTIDLGVTIYNQPLYDKITGGVTKKKGHRTHRPDKTSIILYKIHLKLSEHQDVTPIITVDIYVALPKPLASSTGTLEYYYTPGPTPEQSTIRPNLSAANKFVDEWYQTLDQQEVTAVKNSVDQALAKYFQENGI